MIDQGINNAYTQWFIISHPSLIVLPNRLNDSAMRIYFPGSFPSPVVPYRASKYLLSINGRAKCENKPHNERSCEIKRYSRNTILFWKEINQMRATYCPVSIEEMNDYECKGNSEARTRQTDHFLCAIFLKSFAPITNPVFKIGNASKSRANNEDFLKCFWKAQSFFRTKKFTKIHIIKVR